MTYSDTQSQQEVNDILISIRQMISDEESESTPVAQKASPSSQASASADPSKDQILDLTRLVQEDGSVVQLPANSGISSSSYTLEVSVPRPKSEPAMVVESPFLNVLKEEKNPMNMTQTEDFKLKNTENQDRREDDVKASMDPFPSPQIHQPYSSGAMPAQAAAQTPLGTAMPSPSFDQRQSSPTPQIPPQSSDAPQENFLSANTLQESAAAFASLARATENLTPLVTPTPPTAATVSNYTVDTLMRELLKPLLKEWLDAHLPSLVKSLVLEQIEKVLQQQQTTAAA